MKAGWSRVWGARAYGVALVLAAAIIGAGPVVGQSNGYRVQPGDVIGVVIAGLQDSPLQAPVQLDGQVTFPFIGGIDTTGKTIAELQVRIQSAFASRVIPVYTADGRELMRTFGRDQVTASVAEYRPIFVSGDVAQQGEFAFRPGLTVRQAVAAAGGTAYAGAQTALSVDPVRLRADYLRAWYTVAATEARLWRLRTELGGTEPFEPALPPAPGSEATLDRFTQIETELREARALDHQRERTFLMQSLEQIDAQADVLGRQLEAEMESAKIDAENLAAATATDSEVLYTRSRQARLGDITQITNIRGAALMSATRRLQTEANLMQLQRRRTEVAREPSSSGHGLQRGRQAVS